MTDTDSIKTELDALADEHGLDALYDALVEIEHERDEWWAAHMNAQVAIQEDDLEGMSDAEEQQADEFIGKLVEAFEGLEEEVNEDDDD